MIDTAAVGASVPDVTADEVRDLAEKVHAVWWAVHEAMDQQRTAHEVRGEHGGALWSRLYEVTHGLSCTAMLLELAANVLDGTASRGTEGNPKVEVPR